MQKVRIHWLASSTERLFDHDRPTRAGAAAVRGARKNIDTTYSTVVNERRAIVASLAVDDGHIHWSTQSSATTAS